MTVTEEQAFKAPTDLDLSLGLQLRIFDPQLCEFLAIFAVSHIRWSALAFAIGTGADQFSP